MSQPGKHHEELSPLKRAYLALEKAQTRLEAFEGARHEGIAVVGMSCRFPGGVNNPSDYWNLLAEGRDAIVEVPPSRWDVDELFDPNPDAPGKVASRFGGFLDNVDRFDAALFGIAPREAESLDPQQRLLLEVAHEALEDGAAAGDGLSGSATGVFVGLANGDYYCLLTGNGRGRIDAYTGTGTSPNSAAGRVSYVFGLRGPCVAVDTACSSSLVAIHLACQSLRNGECDMALAGGVNVMLAPDLSITFSKAHMLCLDGRCKTFDAAANGYVRGEGVGLILLKRLSDALAANDRILAVIRGSAVNHVGASGGLTVPNGPAQQDVIHRALAVARLRPDEVDYVEAHGTGTALGDPIEVGALGAVFAARKDPLWIASVKTNVGHLEAAAGIAGVIKVVLSLQHDQIPPHLHFQTPSPRIPWQQLPLQVPTRRQPWSPSPRLRVAGVSSFGFSGINAHVVLAESPAAHPTSQSSSKPPARPPPVAPLGPPSRRSAPDGRRLRPPLGRRSAAEPRRRLLHRRSRPGTFRAPAGSRGPNTPTSPRPPGTICRWPVARRRPPRPGRQRAQPRCFFIRRRLGPSSHRSLALRHRARLSRRDRPLRRQLEKPSRLHRGRSPRQRFASTPICPNSARRPSSRSRTPPPNSGNPGAFGPPSWQGRALANAWPPAWPESSPSTMRSAWPSPATPQTTTLRTSSAWHVDTTYARPHRRLILASAEDPSGDAPYGAEHWAAPDCTADLARCTAQLISERVDTILEIGPRTPFLSNVCSHWTDAVGTPAKWLAGLSEDQPEEQTLLENLAELYVSGTPIDWPSVAAPFAGRKVALPTYPFQRRRFWVDGPQSPTPDSLEPPTTHVHPLLGRRILLAAAPDLLQFESRLSGRHPAILKEHRLAGVAIMPAAGFFEMALAAARQTLPPDQEGPRLTVEGIMLSQALPFGQQRSRTVQTAIRPDAPGHRVELYSRPTDGDPANAVWTLHARGRLAETPHDAPSPHADLEPLRHRLSEEVPLAGFYEQFESRGLQYGPLFRGLKRLWRGQGEALGQVELSPEAQSQSGDYLFYPPLLDACLHVTANLIDPRLDQQSAAPVTYVPIGVDRMDLFASPGATVWSHARLRDPDASPRAARYAIDVDLWDPAGNLLARLEGLHVQQVDLDALAEELLQRQSASERDAAHADGQLADELARLPDAARHDRVIQFLESQVSKVLKLPPGDRPGLDRNLFELGLDSLMSVELLYRLNEALRINLPMQVLLDHAAIRPLADAIVREIGQHDTAPVDAPPTPPAVSDTAQLRLLVCAQPADASLFSQWPDALRPDIEVCPIPLPETADEQALARDGSNWAQTAADEVLDLLDRPFALLGYRSGAHLALQLAQVIRQRFGLSPEHLLAIGQTCPDRPREPLECSLTVLAAADDPSCPPESLSAWQDITLGSFRLETLPGTLASHLQSPAELLQVIRRHLQQA